MPQHVLIVDDERKLVQGLGAFIVGLLISGRVTRPLRSLKDAAQRLALGVRHDPLAPLS